ncbi:MAG: MBL fold metallo-hydrolase [Solirubrobacterales bacterium]
MIGTELAPGLWRWTDYHPDWREDVGCVALLRGDDLVLVDPLLSAEDEWEKLARASQGRALHVVLTVHWHARSAAEVLARFPQARVWAHATGAAPVRRRTPVTDTFRPGDPLPAGIEAYPGRPRNEVVFWDTAAGAVLPGDVLLGDPDGGVRMCPASWLPSSATIGQLREKLLPLLDLPVEMVLVSHGEPVLSDGHAALAAALDT